MLLSSQDATYLSTPVAESSALTVLCLDLLYRLVNGAVSEGSDSPTVTALLVTLRSQ